MKCHAGIEFPSATPWQERSARQWAEQFGVKRSTIDRIRSGLTYRYFKSAEPSSETPSQDRGSA